MTTYYVGTGGNNASAGTSWGARWLTLTKAASVVAAGDTVYCQGTFRETLTLSTAGTVGSPIAWIGDYLGTHTSGSKGVARITGSDDDLSATRARAINIVGKNYNTFNGFTIDSTTGETIQDTTGAVGVSFVGCAFQATPKSNTTISVSGGSQSAWTFSNCVFMPAAATAVSIYFSHSSLINNSGHVIQNCIFVGSNTGTAVRGDLVGGWTAKNCLVFGSSAGFRYIGSPSVPSTAINVNNCQFIGVSDFPLISDIAGAIVEDYNNLWACASRLNVSTGAHSTTRPALLDTRWFFEATNGGTLITPFDLASYSTLVEYNSGSGAPPTDLRGASQTGSFREWGPLEYNAGLSVAGGSATAAYPVVGGGIIRGVG